MIFQQTSEVANQWIIEVQNYFANNPLTQAYRWSPDNDETQIRIIEYYPDAMRFFPFVMIYGVVGDTVEMSFSQVAGPEYDQSDPPVHIGERFTGDLLPRVEFRVESTSDADTKRIVDLLTIGIARYMRFSINAKTNNRIKVDPPVVRVSGRGSRPYGDTSDKTRIYSTTISIGCRVTWMDVVLYDDTLSDVIPAITITDG